MKFFESIFPFDSAFTIRLALAILCGVVFMSEKLSQAYDRQCTGDIIVEKIASGLAWSPNGSKLAVASFSVDIEQCILDAKLEIFDGGTGQIIYSIPQAAPIFGIVWHPNNVDLFTGDDKGTVRQWNTSNGQLAATHQISNFPILSLSWNPQGTHLASGGHDNVIRILNTSGEIINSNDLGTSDLPGLATSIDWVSYSPDGLKIMTSGADGAVKLRDATTLSEIMRLPAQFVDPVAGKWNPNGDKLATSGNDNTVQIWDSSSTDLILTLQGHSGRITTISWNLAGDQLATGSLDGSVRIWNATTGQVISVIQAQNLQEVWRIDWSSTGNLVYGGLVSLTPSSGTPPPLPPIVEFLPSSNPTPTPTPTNTPTPTLSPTPGGTFPVTGVLDDFNRADGPIGSNWSIAPGGYSILNNRLDIGSGGSILWSPSTFGANQEAFITLTTPDADAEEIDLLLKQAYIGQSYRLVEVWYQPVLNKVQVWTHDPTAGWVQRGSDIAVTFAAGDQFGARAKADGTVEVYKNGTLVGSADVSGWSYYADGGAIGLWMVSAGDGVLDDFGGGDVT